MKITSSPGTSFDASVPVVASGIAPNDRPAAFQQVLRQMEKDMWPGARSGRMTGDPLPEPLQRQAETSRHARAAFEAPPGVDTPGKSSDRNAATAASACAYANSTAGSLSFGISARALQVPDQIASNAWLMPSVAPYACSPQPGCVAEPPFQPTSLSSTKETALLRLIERVTTQSTKSGAPPLRITVMSGETGVSIAVRMSAGPTGDLDTLTQRACEELTRHGARDARRVRLIVNGIAQLPTPSRGSPHGY